MNASKTFQGCAEQMKQARLSRTKHLQLKKNANTPTYTQQPQQEQHTNNTIAAPTLIQIHTTLLPPTPVLSSFPFSSYTTSPQEHFLPTSKRSPTLVPSSLVYYYDDSPFSKEKHLLPAYAPAK